MANKFSTSDFLEKSKSVPILDVRSPGEFKRAHIPGAISLPLFSDEERAKVGTCYKQQGKDKAVELGLEFVGPKLAEFVKFAKKIAVNGEVLVHCWRGGMRSGSMAWLLETAGLQVGLLEGGYKSYRNFVLQTQASSLHLRVIGGKTGSGKTELLKLMKSEGFQVIDLEALAKHRGSAFGHFGLEEQPSSEHFENLLCHELLSLDLGKPIWVEDESRHIGKVFMNFDFYNQLRSAPVLFMDISAENRLPHLVDVYASYPKEMIEMALDKIKKRLGGNWHKEAIQALEKGDFYEVGKISLTYYDKAYLYGLEQRENVEVKTIEVNSIDTSVQLRTIRPFIEAEIEV
ncbi:MAG: hypothetical protein RI995_815 [Bacteroidota bacterium]